VVEARGRVGGAATTEELIAGYRFSTCAYALHLLHEEVVRRLELDLPRLLELPPRVAILPDGTRVGDGDLEPEAFARWEGLWDEAARAVDPHLIGRPPEPAELGLQHLASTSNTVLLAQMFRTAEARAVYAPRYDETRPDVPGGPLAYAYMETGRCRREEHQGVPEGGMGALVDAFARAAPRVRLATAVVRIEPGRGVVLGDGTRIEARAVVSNADPARTASLLGERPPELDLAPAGAKLHCALRGRPAVESGLVHVYPRLDWYAHCHPDRAEASLVEIQVPTLVDDSLAPAGDHCLSAYVPFAPRGRPDELRALLLDRIRLAVPNLDDVLVDCVLHGPEELESRLGLTNAQIHHVAHSPSHMYAQRGDGTTAHEGVFLCGAGIHPGGEVSGVPGLNTATLVAEYLS
jgi:phytoene dehydrogenase-like protein